MVGDQDVDMTKRGPRLADQTGWRIGFRKISTERLNSPPRLHLVANGRHDCVNIIRAPRLIGIVRCVMGENKIEPARRQSRSNGEAYSAAPRDACDEGYS